MSKQIETLVPDIYSLFENDNWTPDPEHVEQFGRKLGQHIANRASETRGAPTLRFSNLGTNCDRKLWYTINTPELGEPLSPPTRIKFLFGDILEELLLFLATEAGHKVEAQQDTVEINGVIGHMDAVIDGRVVDCKSASTYSFKKFQQHGLVGNDPFAYIDQLGAYLSASSEDERVVEKDVASFLVIDKTLGNICLDTYPLPEVDYNVMVDSKRELLSQALPPERTYESVPEGKSGNMKLGTVCSYCNFKATCYPALQTYLYSTGPVYLTEVVRAPKVPQLNSNGEVTPSGDF